MGTLFRFRSKKQLIESFGFSRTSSGFTLLETIIVLVILTILTVPAFINSSTSLEEARDQLIADIRYTQNLALLNSKFQSVPKDSSITEKRRTKFWFKSRWQIFVTYRKTSQEIYYLIFSDMPTSGSTTTFDRGTDDTEDRAKEEILVDHFTKGYSIGSSDKLEADVSTMNLTKSYGIDKIELESINDENKYISNNPDCKIFKMTQYNSDSYYLRLIFDYLGRPYCYYDEADTGDFNPFTYSYYGNSNKNSLIRDSFQVKLWKKDDYLCLTIEGLTGLVYADSCKF